MRADLHAHTTASDGTCAPAELVSRAVELGLEVLAITDHDSVGGLASAIEAARDTGLALVPGVELSAVDDERDVHVLGYFIDAQDPALISHLTDLRTARRRRAESIVEALEDSGYRVTLDDVLSLSDGGAVGRSHVARALVDRGHATSIADAFHRLLGREAPFYVPKDVRAPADVLGVILDAGGIPVLAHPGVSGVEDLVRPLTAIGLAGVEAYHADHPQWKRVELARLARCLGILATGGTDFHGPSGPNPDLGSVEIPEADIEALLAAGSSKV